MKKPQKIGIMGGTFNPIHTGHLVVAEEVREKFGLDRVLFIPTGMPPHKPDGEVIDAEHRYEMVRRAVASSRFFEASRLEIDRGGYTYTVNTLMELKREYGGETFLFFIIGADVVCELTAWKEFRKVFEMCEFIAVFRPGFDRASFETGIMRLINDYGAVIHEVDARLIDISSRELREKRSKGESIKYLVPDAVEDYIIEKGLYKKTI